MRDRSPGRGSETRAKRPFRREAPIERAPGTEPPRTPTERDSDSRRGLAIPPRHFPPIEKTTLLATTKEAGRRLDALLNEKVPGLSRRIAKDLIAIGAVWVNDRRIKTSSRLVAAGDVIVVHRPADLSAMPGSALETRICVLHEDESLVVVEKPAGLPVQGTPAQDVDTLFERVKRYVGAASRSPHRAYVGLMHRLDRFASGAVVFSKDRLANRELARQFFDHTIRREYIALVRGVVRESEFERTSHLHWDARAGIRSSGAEHGRFAHTVFRVEERFRAHTLVRALPRTGRTHQIRIHLADIRHPIVADPVYGAGDALEDDYLLVSRLSLHAHVLGFRHPITERSVLVTSPIPSDIDGAVLSLRASSGDAAPPI